jgi:hypothetical protein
LEEQEVNLELDPRLLGDAKFLEFDSAPISPPVSNVNPSSDLQDQYLHTHNGDASGIEAATRSSRCAQIDEADCQVASCCGAMAGGREEGLRR